MTGLVGRRVATAAGAMLIAAHSRAAFETDGERLFTPGYWEQEGVLTRTSRGRGSSWFVAAGDAEWALRHYRRGGWLAARFSMDRFLWRGERRVRAFAEWHLLRHLYRRGLPVPEPVAARYRRGLLTYSCDLITRRIVGTQPLSDVLAADRLATERWQALGATLARFHAAGVDHADLNAHNILMSPDGVFSVIDFDRGRLRSPGAWREQNLARLRRSLQKVTMGQPDGRFAAADWDALLAGYVRAPAAAGSGPR